MTTKRSILIGAPVAASIAAFAIAGCGATKTDSATASSSGSTQTTVDVADTTLGRVLADPDGRTLYMFAKDKGSTSACYGACASAWPPFRADGAAKAGPGAAASMVATTPRSDGQAEVTYDGHPLYYYAGDQSAGDTNGQGLKQFGGRWYVVSPSGAPIEDGTSTSSSGSDGY